MLLPILLISTVFTIAPVSAFSSFKRAVCTPEANPDPSIDDVPAINAALKNCGDGGRVLLPVNSTYTVGSPIDLSACRACDFQINGVLEVTADWDYWSTQSAIFSVSNVTAAVIRSDGNTGVINAQWYGLAQGSLVPFSNIRLFSIAQKSHEIHVSGLTIQNVPGTVFSVNGGSAAIRAYDINFENEVRRAYEIQDASHVYVWNNTIRVGEVCVRVAPNATNVQWEESVCIVNGTLNGGGRKSGIELNFGSSAPSTALQWARNVFVKHVKFVGSMDAVSLKSGSDHEITVEVYNATFTDIELEGPVRRPVYLGVGDLGDEGCGQTKCTRWNITDVTWKDFEGSAVEQVAPTCTDSADVCQWTTEGWNITYT